MNDERIAELLRAARPPVRDNASRRDAWPLIVERLATGPRWSLLDIGLGFGAAGALIIFPEWLVPLVFHL
jgi:hypothetical protein